MTSGTSFRRTKKVALAAALLLTASVTAVHTARATLQRQMGAWGAGAPAVTGVVAAPDYSCYTELLGGVAAVTRSPQMTCLRQSWEIALPVDGTANYAVSFVGKGDTASFNKPCCIAIATDTLGNFTTSGAAVCAPAATFQSHTLNPVFVPLNGSLYLRCSGVVEDLTQLLNVSWATSP